MYGNYGIGDKEYYWGNLGYLNPGDYRLRVYVSINDGAYTSIDSKTITAKNSNYSYSGYNNNYYRYDNSYTYPRRR